MTDPVDANVEAKRLEHAVLTMAGESCFRNGVRSNMEPIVRDYIAFAAGAIVPEGWDWSIYESWGGPIRWNFMMRWYTPEHLRW
jgi:hypothetical protein